MYFHSIIFIIYVVIDIFQHEEASKVILRQVLKRIAAKEGADSDADSSKLNGGDKGKPEDADSSKLNEEDIEFILALIDETEVVRHFCSSINYVQCSYIYLIKKSEIMLHLK